MSSPAAPGLIAANSKNPPEDPREEQNFDLIKRYWTDPEIASDPRVDEDDSDLHDGIDHVFEKIAQCINLAQTTLE